MNFHMKQCVKGPLSNWNKREWDRIAKCWYREDGTTPSGLELKQYFLDKLGEGWEVLPVGDCDNFDKKKGCLGHEQLG